MLLLTSKCSQASRKWTDQFNIELLHKRLRLRQHIAHSDNDKYLVTICRYPANIFGKTNP
jgi:hypothetical protein